MLRIKPHHFLDILRDIGAGRVWEPHPYGHAVHLVGESLLRDHDQRIQRVLGIDEICEPCRNNEDGICTDWTDSPGYRIRKEEWNRRIDERILQILRMREGQVMSAVEYARSALKHLHELPPVWREAPAEKTEWRLENLSRGLVLYLEGSLIS